MTVVTPAEVARRAATIFVDMPPVPRAEPEEETVKLGQSTALEWHGVFLTVSYKRPDVFDDLDGLCIRVGPRVLIIKTVDVSHKEQQVRMHHASGDSRQCIIVAKLDLRDGQCVILVDDRDHTHVEQLVECVLRIEIT